MKNDKKPLSRRQKEILSFIQDFQEEKGYLPSLREILRGCNISSTSVVDYNLQRLEDRGYMKREKKISRGIGLLKSGEETDKQSIPVAGIIAAGQPIPVPASDTWDSLSSAERIEVPKSLTGKRENLFALKVKGTSMIDALIGDGDTVIMQPVSTVDNGDMAAVWLKDEKEVTLKKLYREGKNVRLQPANPRYHPIYVSEDNIEVQGRVIAVLRSLG